MSKSLSVARGCKGMQRLIRYAATQGWEVQRTSGGHLRFSKPGCAPVFTSFTTKDRRAELNARSQLRRAEWERRYRHEE
ncbi:putative RNA binding protein YcfA (HicA-like mRNA interferase family) [Halomonas campaniensis]|uniref:Type II toxin-antitoxin system HicA family toxin n=2 Tax=Halomonas TaxID=2745 RepID=A0A2A2EP64_9GAMM|nr:MULTISPECIES: hypothetical protein [Halomonas]MBB3332558.1 putative RNA binding protein YcfA (HicA-like mRNA interferase family) [Halomonas campaniensis]MDI5922748.1 type II toxin-antitoxin system HicA family toxin [Halomonas rhizosphaerae]PAU74165.1 hypothetical protein CK498_24070 [Halomonas salipaludis]